MSKTTTSEYRSWYSMHSRCYNTAHDSYRYYGGRGIKVCIRWNSFDAFFEDMGEKPFKGASIERKNTNRDYEPRNCRWASQKEQCRNTRSNLILTHLGKSQCLSAWAEEIGMPSARIQARKALGWSDAKALTEPLQVKRLTLNGVTKPLRKWAKELGIGYRTIWFRLSKGWSVENALGIPVMTPAQAARWQKK